MAALQLAGGSVRNLGDFFRGCIRACLQIHPPLSFDPLHDFLGMELRSEIET